MATAVHTIIAPAASTPVLALVSNAPNQGRWSDREDVRAIAAAIVACDGIAAKLACLPIAHDAADLLGMIGTDLRLSSTSRMRIRVARPSTADSVLGQLWAALDETRDRWIKAKLGAAGLGHVWDDPDASREDMLRAHEMKSELETEAPEVAEVVGAARSVGGEG